MTKDDIIRMALEAGFDEHRGNHPVGWGEYPISNEVIERFAVLVAAAEREECAKVCKSLSKDRGMILDEVFKEGVLAGAAMCAEAIRARGNSEVS